MQPVNLFDLASQQARWLSVRQSAVAGNVANVNTPGYGAVEVEPFEGLVGGTRVAMAATDPRHISTGDAASSWAIRRIDDTPSASPSDNTVVLEDELMKAGEIKRSFELNTAIVKAFHRMFVMSVRS